MGNIIKQMTADKLEELDEHVRKVAQEGYSDKAKWK